VNKFYLPTRKILKHSHHIPYLPSNHSNLSNNILKWKTCHSPYIHKLFILPWHLSKTIEWTLLPQFLLSSIFKDNHIAPQASFNSITFTCSLWKHKFIYFFIYNRQFLVKHYLPWLRWMVIMSRDMPSVTSAHSASLSLLLFCIFTETVWWERRKGRKMIVGMTEKLWLSWHFLMSKGVVACLIFLM